MTETKKVRILVTGLGSCDQIHAKPYHAGEIYDVPSKNMTTELAEVMVADSKAEWVHDRKSAPANRDLGVAPMNRATRDRA